MKVKKETKKVVKKKSASKVPIKKHAPRVVAIRKIIVKKLDATHIAARNRKVPVRKIAKFIPVKKESPILFFSLATMRSIAFIIIIALTSISLRSISGTDAYFNDLEVSNGNSYVAGEVNFTLTQTPYSLPETVISLESGPVASSTIKVIPEASSNPFWYHASTTNFGNDIDFCQTLNVKSSLLGVENYSGLLSEFISPATTTIPDWQMDISTNVNSYNKICTFDFEYSAWQERHNLPEFDEMGFSDTEKVGNIVASWGFRINKIYYDVKTPERGIEGNNGSNEWVEIYNQTDIPLDINGWHICDNNSCDTLASTSPIMIPAKGFAVVTATSTTWKYWDMPSDVVKIELGSEIGNGLGNNGDKLVLKRPDGAVIDEMNWQNNTEVWNPGVVGVPEGHMLGRKPNGYDTNQASDFIDMAVPVVLLINPDQSGLLTWYWTYNYNITWTATNPNGPDSDIKIDLSYIKDINQSGIIEDDDETVSIATGLSNIGSYLWQLPSGFLGYIWVKIVAVGPENPMLNARMISGKIWDPFPAELWVTDPEEVMESIINALSPEDSQVSIDDILDAGTPVTEIEPILGPVVPQIEEVIIEESAPMQTEIAPEAKINEEVVEPVEEAIEDTAEVVEVVVPDVVEVSSVVVEPEVVVEEPVPVAMPVEPVVVPEEVLTP